MDEISFIQRIEFIHDRLANLQQFIHEFPQTFEQQQHVQQLFQQLATQLAACHPAYRTGQQSAIGATLEQAKEQAEPDRPVEGNPINQQLAAEILEHQRTTAALRASEAKLNAILSSAVVAITSLRIFANQDCQCEYRSPGCEAIFGYSADELITDGTLWFSSVHPEDLEAVILPAFNDIFAERSPTVEYRFRHKDGEWRWISETIFSQRDATADCWSVTVVSTDISDRKQAEATLLQQTEILQTIFDHVPVMLALFDLDGKPTWVNREWETVLGWSVQDLSSSFLEKFYPDPAYHQYVLDFIQSADRRWGDFKTHIRDGRILDTAWANVRLSNGQCIGIGQDITQRKQTESMLRQQAEREQALNRVIQTIHNSLDLNTIFTTTVSEVGALLHADIAGIMRYLPDHQVWLNVATYCQNFDHPNITGIEVLKADHDLTSRLQHFEVVQINQVEPLDDRSITGLSEVTRMIPGAWLLVPLRIGSTLWGSLSLVRSQLPAAWQAPEIDLARTIADQLAIAIQQSELYVQVQRLNAELERQVKVRTAQLQLAYESEATLKRITDRVRDSLDEDQILQTAVHELAQSLGATCCNAALFDLDAGTSTICYEYTQIPAPAKGRVSRVDDFPELYYQLLQGQHFQFCSLLPHPFRGRVAMLACPILDDQSVMGDLWIINQSYHAFSEPDIRLVQQVANQCAIALRQSRLYQTAQTQVQELEKLNHLKDDFLSTVSHELRSPMSSIKMAIQMLQVTLFVQNDEPVSPIYQKASRYFKILQDECQREINLINNLLDLSRLEADTEPVVATPVHLNTWLPQVVEPFMERALNQQQQIKLNVEANLTILTQPAHLERILTELLNNACKYTPAGETITLSVQSAIAPSQTPNEFNKNLAALSFHKPASSDPRSSLLGWQAPANQTMPSTTTGALLSAEPQQSTAFLAIHISNSGVEIPDAECDRIFDKFYRIPNNDPWKHGGTGLGLALVKKLVEHLGGTIKVISKNKQTTFLIHLPM